MPRPRPCSLPGCCYLSERGDLCERHRIARDARERLTRKYEATPN